MYTEKEKVTNNFTLEQVKTDTKQNDDDGGGDEEAYNFNARNDARLDGIERLMAEQNRMLSEILELLLIQQPEVHKEKSMPSRLKKTSFASIKNDENTDTRREASMVDAKRKSSSSSSSSLRKHAIARQQQQICGDSLQERKAKFALKTVQIEDDKKGLRSSTALAVEAAKRNMSRQTAAKLQEEESDGNNNSVASWIVTLLIVLAGICAFGLGIVAVLVKDTNSEALDSSTEL